MTEVKKTGPFERMVTLTIDADALEVAKVTAARRMSREIKIKGFRPGKAPTAMVERVVGPERLREEAIDEILPSVVTEAIVSEGLEPVVTPSVSDVRDSEDGTVEVDIRVTEWPTIDEAPQYLGRRVVAEAPDVSDEALEEQVDRMRDQFAELEDVDREGFDGDYVLMDVRTSRDGEEIAGGTATDMLFEIGSESFLEGLDEAARGLAAGHIAEFDTTLPPTLAGDGEPVATANVLIKQVKSKKLPELTDEWVADITEFETVEELRTTLRGDLERYHLGRIRGEVEEQLMTDLRAEVDIVLPEALAQAEIEGILHRFAHRLEQQGISIEQYLAITGQQQEAFVEDLRQQADGNLLGRIVIEAIIEAEGLEADAAEIDAAITSLADAAETPPEEYRAALVESGQEQSLAGDILRRKAIDLVVDTAEVVDADGSAIDIPKSEPMATEQGEATESDETPDEADGTDADDDAAETEADGDVPEATEGEE